MKYLSVLTVFAFALLMSVSLASAQISIDLPANNDVINDKSINYEVTITGIPSDLVTQFTVSLVDASTGKTLRVSSERSGDKYLTGTFDNVPDGDYYVYAKFNNSTGIESDMVEVTVDNPFELDLYDPTPENGAVINSLNIDDSNIVAIGSKVSHVTITFVNASGESIEVFNDNTKETDYSISDSWDSEELVDGEYDFTVFAMYNGGVVNQSYTRHVTIKATVPTAEFEDVVLPETVDEDTEFSFSVFNVSVSENPVKVRVTASGTGGFKILGTHSFANLTAEELDFTSIIPNPGVYDITLTVFDNYGNSESYDLGEMNVNDLPDPEVSERRRGGRNGNSADDNIVNTSRYNLRTEYLDEDAEDETETVPEEEGTEEQTNFFSAITGAVTGAFATPSRAILTFIIVVVIIYAAVKIRGYIVADESKSKKKKNGKGKEKEEQEVDSE